MVVTGGSGNLDKDVGRTPVVSDKEMDDSRVNDCDKEVG